MPKALHRLQWTLLKGEWLGRCYKCSKTGKIVSWNDRGREGLCLDCYKGLQTAK